MSITNSSGFINQATNTARAALNTRKQAELSSLEDISKYAMKYTMSGSRLEQQDSSQTGTQVQTVSSRLGETQQIQ